LWVGQWGAAWAALKVDARAGPWVAPWALAWAAL
jgi:hypothetical protein